MVAQLVLNDQGVYEYKEVQQPVKRTINNQAFEAYERQKKEELVSAPSVTEQTEKITREIPGQVTFDEKTGQFKQVDTRKQAIDYTPGAITPESTEATALDKVLSMQPMSGTQDCGLDIAYKLIEQQQKLAQQQQKFQNIYQTAKLGVDIYNIASGKDIAIKNITPLKFKSPTWTGMNVGKSTLGGVGTAGSANIGKTHAMFEAIHGSAPRMVKEGRAKHADPSSLLRAGAMLLDHIGFIDLGSKLNQAIDVCGMYEKRLVINGRDSGATSEEYGKYILETIKNPELNTIWHQYSHGGS